MKSGETYSAGTKEGNPNAKKRLLLQISRKKGCQAHISIQQIIRFPEFKLPFDSQNTTSAFKRARADTVKELQKALKNSTATYTQRFFVSLPDVDAHSNHSCGGAAGFAQTVHPAIIEEIRNLARDGITKVADVKSALRRYVKSRLFVDGGIKPEETNRAYYPSSVDIKNHIYLAKQRLKLSKIDQENLSMSINRWQIESPDAKYHFQPYKKKVVSSCEPAAPGKASDETKGFSSSKVFSNTSKVNHIPTESGSPDSQFQQNLLYVHQEKWQQDLLLRYGNTISLIDATYKTTKYDLALFFICVKTNVNYTLVADFIIQHETAELIAEALDTLKAWNPTWKPRFWMTDYSLLRGPDDWACNILPRVNLISL